jgi:HPt (histidine-containing phosphotransfer) domain-containing protein
MDGYDATTAIRAGEGSGTPGRRIPIVALTAHAMKGDRERCLAAGMDDYLPKPLRADDLRAVLERWLEQPSAGVRDDGSGPVGPALAHPDAEVEAAVLERCSGVRALASRLLVRFVDQVGEDLAAIAAADRQGEAEAMARAAHRLKGAAVSLGLAECHGAAVALEVACRLGDAGAVAASAEVLRRQAERIALMPLAREAAGATAG